MKRLHLSLNVTDLSASVAFYSHLFGDEPTLRKADYAQWLLDDPCVNFVLEPSATSGLGHLGVQVDNEPELHALFDQLKSAEAPYLSEGVTECCYHKSEKSWTIDPDGLAWEAFHTQHNIDHRGSSLGFEVLTASAASGCCGASSEISSATSSTGENGACCEPEVTRAVDDDRAEASASGQVNASSSCCGISSAPATAIER